MLQGPRHILVVDDDLRINELIREVLQDEGYTAQGCFTTTAAYTIVEQDPPALIITDLWVEENGSGWHFIQRVRQLPSCAKLPLVLCAANQRFLRDHAAELASLDCAMLEKPFDVDDLVRLVQSLIGAPPQAGDGDRPRARRYPQAVSSW